MDSKDPYHQRYCVYCNKPVNLTGSHVVWSEDGVERFAHFGCAVRNDPAYASVFTPADVLYPELVELTSKLK